MKLLSFYIIFFISFISLSQENLIEKISTISNPTNTIIFTDSILYHNNKLETKLVNEIKYLQALAYQENSNEKKALEIFHEVLPNLN